MKWRDILEAQKFDSTLVYQLSSDELWDAYEQLSEAMPRAIYGDGIDTYVSDLRPDDARSEKEYRSAEIFEVIKNRLNFDDLGRPSEYLAIQLAQRHLDSYDLPEGESVLDSFFYRDSGGDYLGGGWSWLASDIGSRLLARRRELEIETDVEALTAWVRKYPWRMCYPLRYLLRSKRILRENTLDWHAINILRWTETLNELREAGITLEEYFDLGVEAGIEIGASLKALVLKSAHELDAFRGKATKKAARAGAEARKGVVSAETEARLKAMEDYIIKGHGKANAARLTARTVGGTFESNRKLWDRVSKSRDMPRHCP